LGANGYLLKGSTRDQLIAAIRKVAAGEDAWTRDELRRVTGALATPRLAADVDVPLTQRESEVLRQLAFGLTNKEIAQALGISYAGSTKGSAAARRTPARSIMPKPTDVRLLEIRTSSERYAFRAPLKFGGMVVTDALICNATVEMETRDGRRGRGTGSMPMGN